MWGLYHISAWRSTSSMEDRMINRLIVVLIVSLPVTLVLVRWPVLFGVVGGGLCCLALVVMAVQIATSGPRYEVEDRGVAATVDGVPVKEVTVMQ